MRNDEEHTNNEHELHINFECEILFHHEMFPLFFANF